MGVARHDRVEIFLCLGDQRLFKLDCQIHDLAQFLLDIHAHVQRNLIVSRTGGVQTLAGRTDAVGQHDLHIHVDILVFRIKDVQIALLNFLEDFLQILDNLLRLVLLDDALLAQHGRVRDRTGDILTVQAAIKLNRRVKIVYYIIGFLLETSCPKLHWDVLLPNPAGFSAGTVC